MNENQDSHDAPREDPSPDPLDVTSARKQIQEAREQLRRAEACYKKLKQRTIARVSELRDSSCGENLDRGLDFVRKHPGLGVFCAAAMGFLLGGLFRRRH